VTITDDASRSVTVKEEPQRIVSLAPANTETLFALGLGSKVVGVTSYDDYPSEVASITKVGDFQGPNVEAVAAAKPDLILATSGVQADVVKKLEALGATVVVFDPQTLDAVYTDIERTGKITGASSAAEKTVADMKSKVAAIQKATAAQSPVSAFIEIGQNPLFTVGKGTLMDELITLAGGRNVVTQSGYVSYSNEQVIKSNPDVYFATKGSSSDPASIEKRAGFSAISAVKNGRVVILADDIVSRGCPRIVDGLKAIADGLHSASAATTTAQ
jgi:iron complex transport system substrate-binding protein